MFSKFCWINDRTGHFSRPHYMGSSAPYTLSLGRDPGRQLEGGRWWLTNRDLKLTYKAMVQHLGWPFSLPFLFSIVQFPPTVTFPHWDCPGWECDSLISKDLLWEMRKPETRKMRHSPQGSLWMKKLSPLSCSGPVGNHHHLGHPSALFPSVNHDRWHLLDKLYLSNHCFAFTF